MGNGPLEQPLLYIVNYNGSIVNTTNTYIEFAPPEVPVPYFIASVTVTVTAVNIFGFGPTSRVVSAEISKSHIQYYITYIHTYCIIKNYKYVYTYMHNMVTALPVHKLRMYVATYVCTYVQYLYS